MFLKAGKRGRKKGVKSYDRCFCQISAKHSVLSSGYIELLSDQLNPEVINHTKPNNMDDKKITLELTGSQYHDLVKLLYFGTLVAEEVNTDETIERYDELQQQIYAVSGPKKGNLFIAYDKKEDEYFLSEDTEDELVDQMDEYDEVRFWDNLIMRLTVRDLQNKFTEKQLKDMPEDKGNKEMEAIHSYYITEFDDNDLDNLKVVSMKKV